MPRGGHVDALNEEVKNSESRDCDEKSRRDVGDGDDGRNHSRRRHQHESHVVGQLKIHRVDVFGESGWGKLEDRKMIMELIKTPPEKKPMRIH